MFDEIPKKQKAVAYWLLIGVFMIMVQVVLGGIVRLTDSGLSITNWDPIVGIIPPLNHHQWMEAFQNYQQIAQYKYVNSFYTLADFKFIYLWEWFHRLWARFIGVVFIIPFFYFLIKKYFTKRMIAPLVLLFLLGALQGFIGWFMVKSGLGGSNMVRVSHIRLAFHFIAALILLCYTLWFAMKLLVPEGKRVHDTVTKNYFLGVIALLTIQLFYGAFMAGLRAALSAPTWPTINGAWIPAGMMIHSWISNPINVQFVHRGLGYILFFLICFGFYMTWRAAKKHSSSLLKKAGILPVTFVCIQIFLGIMTLYSVSEIVKGKFGQYGMFAQSHQFIAMCLLMSLVVVFYVFKWGKQPARG